MDEDLLLQNTEIRDLHELDSKPNFDHVSDNVLQFLQQMQQ